MDAYTYDLLVCLAILAAFLIGEWWGIRQGRREATEQQSRTVIRDKRRLSGIIEEMFLNPNVPNERAEMVAVECIRSFEDKQACEKGRV